MKTEEKKTILKVLLIGESFILLMMICNVFRLLYDGYYPLGNLFFGSLIIFVIVVLLMIIEYIILKNIRVREKEEKKEKEEK